ncbi:TIGR03943 family protein [Yinghuangia sp. ASG 101]|uniref:TIGR03943 family putative permease subunit n=1 Tax=Yinghuangia sp. ASG 101 TaxID=2896848 RepID=UPI001E5A66E9|nr:TIGR03943 family protein [Yinghuangia sp. ASG 101]UGQ09862.1 TIGR03943 family protein [Yinghuangia sp. ASG 101]
MKRDVQSIVLVLVGAALLRISLDGETYLRYVKEGLRPALVASGAILLALGAVGVIRDGILRRHERAEAAEHAEHAHGDHAGHGHDGLGPQDSDAHDAHGHDHGKGPHVAWLLCLPVAALFLIAPPALGSYTAERSDNTVAKPAAKTVDAGFPALPPGDPLDMTLGEFGVRAVWDTAETLKDRNVRLTGFATSGENGSWYVNRLVISCCAADAVARKVEIHGVPAPPTDTWVTVTGTWLKNGETGSEDATPALTATAAERIPTPKEPYE